MATISQAEINRLKYKTWMSDADITAQLQSKGYTLPTTTQEAGVSIPWFQQTTTPTQTNTQTTQPTGSVSSILGELGAEDPFINRYTQEQLGLYNTPIDENAIRKQKESEFQAQIDAINAVYADKLRQEKLVGQGRIGSSRAIQARSGLIGSDFGTAQTWQVQQLNKEQEAAIESERLALVNQILTQARESAASEIAAKRQAREAGGKAYLEYLAGQQTRKQENTSRAAQLLLLNNKTPEDISDAELAQARISRNDLRLAYSGIKSQQEAEQAKAQAEQEKAALEALKTQSEIDKNQADIINEALKTGRVGNAEAVTRARAIGGGGVGATGWGGYAPLVQTAASTGYNSDLEVIYTKFNDGKMTAADWSTVDKIYGKNRSKFISESGTFRKIPKPFETEFKNEIGSLLSQLADKWLAFRIWADVPWAGYLNTDIADYKSTMETLKSKLTLDNLLNLKNRWATFGALSEWELKAISDSVARLDNNVSNEKYNQIINDLNKKYGTWGIITAGGNALPQNNTPSWEDAYAKYLESIK